jgi:hypothetical protein
MGIPWLSRRAGAIMAGAIMAAAAASLPANTQPCVASLTTAFRMKDPER